MQSRQQGFTLVELIVVIVILGILAATAMPKFMDLSKDARISVMKGVEGSMRGAAMMVYGKAAVAGQIGPTGKVTVDGVGEIDVICGYPTAANIGSLLDLSDTDFDTTTTPGTVSHLKAPDSASCKVVYVAAEADATDGCAKLTLPTYTPTLGGC